MVRRKKKQTCEGFSKVVVLRASNEVLLHIHLYSKIGFMNISFAKFGAI